jgi:hypothetical protein
LYEAIIFWLLIARDIEQLAMIRLIVAEEFIDETRRLTEDYSSGVIGLTLSFICTEPVTLSWDYSKAECVRERLTKSTLF